ncbi:MAG: hypothetical protein ACREEM_06205 [Blastocatellia bacterium]
MGIGGTFYVNEQTQPEYVKGVLAVVRQAIENGILTGVETAETE